MQNGKYDPSQIRVDIDLVQALNEWQLGLGQYLAELTDSEVETALEHKSRIVKAATLHYNMLMNEAKMRKTIKIRAGLAEEQPSASKPKKKSAKRKRSMAGLSKEEKQVRRLMSLGLSEKEAKAKIAELKQ